MVRGIRSIAAGTVLLTGLLSVMAGEVESKPAPPCDGFPITGYPQGGVVVHGIAYFASDPYVPFKKGVEKRRRPADFPFVVAVDLTDFHIVRKYDFENTYDSSPLVIPRKNGNWIVVAHELDNERSVARDRDTGETVWQSEANEPGEYFFGYSYFVRKDGAKIIYAATGNGLHALSSEDGSDVWYFAAPTRGGVTPCVDQGKGVVYYQCRGKLVKLDAESGNVVKEIEVPVPENSICSNTVLVDDEWGYYVGTYWYNYRDPKRNSAIRVYDRDLHLVWEQKNLAMSKKGTLTYAKGKLFAGAGDAWAPVPGDDWMAVTAYNIADGSVAWRCDLAKYAFGSILNVPYFNGFIYAETQEALWGATTSKIFKIDAETGELVEVFDYGVPASSCASCIIARGLLLSGLRITLQDDSSMDVLAATRLAENASGDWPGPFGDPQRNQMASPYDPNAKMTEMHPVVFQDHESDSSSQGKGSEEKKGGDASKRAEEMITRAGNAATDEETFAILKEVENLPNLEPELKEQVGGMVREIDRWLHADSLWYFGKYGKAFQLDINAGSPLYPLICYYRARMKLWIAMEYAGIIMVPEKRNAVFKETRTELEIAHKAFPENPVITMYLGTPIPPRKVYKPAPMAPQWANDQREGIERLTDIIEWWVQNRQRADGLYGGSYDDDCEMWRWWAPVLIAFQNPSIETSQARLSEAIMKIIPDGYSPLVSDVEHASEPSADGITPMMHLDPDNPVWSQRARYLIDLMRDVWTGRNERGLLQFKSTFFSYKEVSEKRAQACDTLTHPRAIQPALLYWQRTGDEAVGKIVADWMDTWVDAAGREERGKPAGIIPSAVRWPDGLVGGYGAKWWKPENYYEQSYSWPVGMDEMTGTLLLTYFMTGNEKYLSPIRSMADIKAHYMTEPPEGAPEPGSAAWCATSGGRFGNGMERFLPELLAKYRRVTGDKRYDEILLQDAPPYTAYRINADTETLETALRSNAEALRINFAGFTREVRFTDRVLAITTHYFRNTDHPVPIPDTQLLYASLTGDPGSIGYFPMNAVRWLTPSREIAALVTDSGPHRFEARLFHFGNAAREMGAELYMLENGTYNIRLFGGAGATEDVLAEMIVEVRGPRTRIDFSLPAQRLCSLRVEPAAE